MSGAYYSEFDPKAAAWLRELIKQGHIADGEVDERDLWDVAPDDIRGFTQVHLCAGVGVWSYALRRSGWDDSRPAWTASFPCQPFSAAGKGLGFADERHLWPAGEHLIRECGPRVLFGEQVASKDAEPWLDAVQADLEALGYAFGACAFPSAGIGAPHIRDRTYWVADAMPAGRAERWAGAGSGSAAGRGGAEQLVDTDGTGRQPGQRDDQATRHRPPPAAAGLFGGLADDDDEGLEGRRQPGRERAAERSVGAGGVAGGLADAEHAERGPVCLDGQDEHHRHDDGRPEAHGVVGARGEVRDPGPTNGLWRDADWLLCRDGKWRPVEPGTFPLAHGAPARVGRLRGYGNAVNASAAQAWIESYLDAEAERLRLTALSEMTPPNVFD